MIDVLVSFFQGVANFFVNVWSIVTMIATKIADLFKMAVHAIKFGISLVSMLPPIYSIIGTAIVLVLIVYLILGREAGN